MEALSIPIIEGRRFLDSDTAESPGAVIISQAMAKRYWPGRSAIGERIWFDGVEPKEHWLTIVGVSADVRQSSLTQPGTPMAYVCYSQLQIPAYLSSASVVVRWRGEARKLTSSVRGVVREVHPDAAITTRTLEDVLAGATAGRRFETQVLTGFAAASLMLAILGLYGVISYTVASTQASIGIRMALGARPMDVFRSTVGRALGLTAIGAAIGILGCLGLRRLLSRFVFGIDASDPLVLAGSAVAMLVVAFAASVFPARRAMQVDAALAMRSE
jgi:ABC-type antimicrobial peptide transport system permease subunit